MEISENIDFVFWLGTCLMVLLVFAFVILAITYQNFFIRMKKKESDLLLKTALKVERQERQRIAADIHDGLLSDLSAVNVYLTIVKKNGIEDCYDDIKEGVDQAIESARQISSKLIPPLLESHGLIISLENYFQKLSLKTNIDFLVLHNDYLNIPISKKYEVFRILQEISTNMVKHGKPTKCQISLNTLNANLEIHVIDDGLMFDFNDSLKQSSGSGLKNIASRLKILDGTIKKQEAVSGNYYILYIKI